MVFLNINSFASLTLALIVVLIALYLRKNDDADRLNNVLNGLLRAEEKGEKLSPEKPRVAIGFGGCVDVFADSIEFMKMIDVPIPNKPQHHYSLEDINQFAETFAYFFEHGAAGERYVHDKKLFEKMNNAATSLKGFRTALGGNAPVMANRMALEGCEILLGAFLTKTTEGLLHSSIRFSGKSLEKDDVHLILEYPKDAVWEKYKAPRANRFIVHSDTSNPTLSSLESFAENVATFKPHLLVVGGLQMMDSFPFHQGVMEERLGALRQFLADTSRDTLIHLELASFADENLMQQLIQSVVLYSDSLGMNEQELPNLHSMMTSGNITLISDPYPRIATTLDHMRSVWKLLRSTEEVDGKRRITRLHVHTLAYQAIMVTKGSSWKNTMAAAAKASLTANRHVCGSAEVDTDKARLIMDESFSTTRTPDAQTRKELIDERPVTCWDEEDVELCIAPVLVCTDVVQTAGGGDNISSAGLVLQI